MAADIRVHVPLSVLDLRLIAASLEAFRVANPDLPGCRFGGHCDCLQLAFSDHAAHLQAEAYVDGR